MRAQVGDWLVLESPQLDGTPPYDVHWTEDDRETLFFPGPETHVVGTAEQAAGGRGRA